MNHVPKRLATVLVILSIAAASAAAPECGDLDGSGSNTTSDALLLLRDAVGQDVDLVCAPPAQPAKTGESFSYGAKSDGAQRVGVPRSFVDNGDGTITDEATGLMWEKKDNAGGLHDKDNEYTWSASGTSMDGTIVTEFLAGMNAGSGFAGYKDWRIPNRFELETLLDVGEQSPTTHLPFVGACPTSCTVLTCSCTRLALFWSSTSFSADTTGAWAVDFRDADVTPLFKTADHLVRAVRGGT